MFKSFRRLLVNISADNWLNSSSSTINKVYLDIYFISSLSVVRWLSSSKRSIRVLSSILTWFFSFILWESYLSSLIISPSPFGKVKKKVEPFSDVYLNPIFPPIESIILLAIPSPRPNPLVLVYSDSDARVLVVEGSSNILKRDSFFRGSTPHPLSEISTLTKSLLFLIFIDTFLPLANFNPLETMLQKVI